MTNISIKENIIAYIKAKIQSSSSISNLLLEFKQNSVLKANTVYIKRHPDSLQVLHFFSSPKTASTLKHTAHGL